MDHRFAETARLAGDESAAQRHRATAAGAVLDVLDGTHLDTAASQPGAGLPARRGTNVRSPRGSHAVLAHGAVCAHGRVSPATRVGVTTCRPMHTRQVWAAVATCASRSRGSAPRERRPHAGRLGERDEASVRRPPRRLVDIMLIIGALSRGLELPDRPVDVSITRRPPASSSPTFGPSARTTTRTPRPAFVSPPARRPLAGRSPALPSHEPLRVTCGRC